MTSWRLMLVGLVALGLVTMAAGILEPTGSLLGWLATLAGACLIAVALVELGA